MADSILVQPTTTDYTVTAVTDETVVTVNQEVFTVTITDGESEPAILEIFHGLPAVNRLSQAADVNVSQNLINGAVLTYDSTAGAWVPGLSGVGSIDGMTVDGGNF